MQVLRNKKTPVWETVKLVLRMTVFYAPLLLGLILDVEQTGILAGLSTAIMSLDKWKFESSKDNRGLVSF